MKVIIAGSRSVTDYGYVEDAMREAGKLGIVPTQILSGHAKGVDHLGERWADEHKIPCSTYPADWRLYGRAAGPIRNIQMVEEADALVAIHDGKSKGTAHVVGYAMKQGLKVYVKPAC